VGASAVALLVEVDVDVDIEEETELVDVFELRPGRPARTPSRKPRAWMLLAFCAVV
jgi:hypothetical protein